MVLCPVNQPLVRQYGSGVCSCALITQSYLCARLRVAWFPGADSYRRCLLHGHRSRPLVSSDLRCPEMVTMNPQESSVLGATLLAVEIQPLSYE